ncbi:MAG: thiolase family protein [Lachnospiraceae bacterium]
MKTYLIDGVRSFIGIEGGLYKNNSAQELGAGVINALLSRMERQAISPKEIDLVIAGNGVGGGGNIARLMALSSRLPTATAAYTIDLQCGSALESIAIADAKIKAGQADFILAGGFESCSTAPLRSYHPNHPGYEDYRTAYGKSEYTVAQFSPGTHRETAMLEGAEETARRLGIARQDLNHWVIRSHENARNARDNGHISHFITAITPTARYDEGIREKVSERLLNYVPLLLADGNVLTAANTCFTNDGAAFLAIASEDFVQKHHLTPLAEFIDSAQACVNPVCSPMSITAAIDALLLRNELKADDISVFECNEAFAVIDEMFYRHYGDKAMTRYNLYGGALAYGHPYGASGGIITLHGLAALKNTGGNYGVFAIAAAGGIGTAMLVKMQNE